MDDKVLMTSKYVLFLGGWPSQWTKAPFVLGGTSYNCCEQYMIVEKARVFDDRDAEAQILATNNPAKQKALGRDVKGFDQKVWDSMCRGIVFRGNLAKYDQNVEFKSLLLGTGKRTLVEASPRDRIWGIGLHQDDPKALVPAKWRGKNWLGIALMQVRDELRRKQGLVAPDPDHELQQQLDRRDAIRTVSP